MRLSYARKQSPPPFASALTLLLFLCSVFAARGQAPISITASIDPVCRDATAQYSAPRTNGVTYVWTVTTQGNAGPMTLTPTTTGIPVNWVAAGAATVTVQGFNSSNALTELGTLNTTVLPRPTPYITLDTRVGCQNLQRDTPVPEPLPTVPDEPENCIKTCAFSQTTFTAHGAAGSTYNWSVTGGTIAATSGATCTVNWGAAGPGSISVTETTDNGCTGTRTNCIEVIPSPTARFFALPDSNRGGVEVCLNQAIVFVDRSTAGSGSPIVTWLWDFGDGNTTTATSGAPITHSYNAAGDYTVQLTVINQCNCRSTFEMQVHVNPDQGVEIACPSVVCEGARNTYTVNANCSQYDWSVDGGSIIGSLNSASIMVVWNQVDASGFGYVYFNNSGSCGVGCPSITVIKVPVIQKTGTIDGPPTVCANKSVLYRLPQWPTTTFNWTVSGSTGATLSTTDQRNEILLNTVGAGTVLLHCNYYNTLLKCGGQATMTVTISAPPVITGPAKACTGNSMPVTYTASAPGDWSMTTPGGGAVTGPSGATSWTPNFTVAGIHRIRLTGSFCSPEPLVVAVKAPPAAPDSLLGPASACTNTPVLYRAKNSMSGAFFTWSASVPANTSFNLATGNSTYATFSGSTSNVISVQRAWSDLPGCISAPLTRTITRPPGSPFITGKINPCTNKYESYNAGASFTDADYYEWSIASPGMGSISSGQGTPNATILWNNAGGNATVRLKARRCDSLYFATLSVVVNGVPAVTIVPANATVCANDPVAFSATPADTAAIYSWDLGQRQITSNTRFPVYAYTTTGSANVTYPVSVTITNVNGCPGATATVATNITVKPAPVGNLTPAGRYYFCGAANISLPAPLTANAQPGFGGPVTTVQWYQNGLPTTPPSGSAQPSFSYGTVSQFGAYYAVLTGSNGCSVSTDPTEVMSECGTCTVAPGYTVSISQTDSGCGTVGLSSSWTAGGRSQWWSEPSGQSSVNIASGTNSSTASYTFTRPGVFTVSSVLWFPAAGGGGDTCLASKSIQVTVPYLANLRSEVTCVGSGYTVNLYDNSPYYPGTPITSYQLYRNIGPLLLPVNTSTTPTNVTQTNMAPGTYTYTLVIQRTGYAACTTTTNLLLPPIPAITSLTASRTTACINDAVTQFTPTVTPAGAYYHGYLWDFGDGTGNKQEIVSKVYSELAPPTKTVKLTITNSYGCTATDSTTVVVVPDNLSGSALSTPPYPCDGQIVNVYYAPALGSTTPLSYTWYQPLNKTPLTASGSSLNVTDPGGFFVKVEDAFGCTHPTNVAKVNFVRIPTPVITGDTDQCEQKAFTLSNNAGPGNYTYNWFRNGSFVQSGPSAEWVEIAGLPAGTYTYTLTVVASNAPAGTCQKQSAPLVVVVHGLPALRIDPPTSISCQPYTLELSANASVPGTFNWSNGMSGNPITVYAGGDYRVYFTDAFGCSSKTDTLIPRDPNAYLWIFPTGCYVLCPKDLPFQLVGPQAQFDYWSWMYNGNTDLDGANSFVAPYSITRDGLYNLFLKNDLCAVMSGDMNVKIDNSGCEKTDSVSCDIPVSVTNAYGRVEDESCKWYVELAINNPYGMTIPYQINSSVGFAVPFSGVLTGVGTFGGTYRMVFPTSFTGGVVTLTLTFDLGKGQYCTKQVRFNVTPCGGGIPWGKMAPPGSGKDSTIANLTADQSNALVLAPNPATQTVSISYTSTGDGTVEVYDVLGRKAAVQTVRAGTGVWKLDVASYVPGTYRVILRNGEGRVVLHQALSVQH